jgi:HD-GYP domain-containing protein (c-di-GMP phosphodiesterase class II)
VLKKIPVRQLAMGMFVDGLEGPWLNHPFWRTKFLIKDEATLRRLKESGVAECRIDLARGNDVASVTPGAAAATAGTAAEEAAAASAAAEQGAPFTEELQRAAELRNRSGAAMRHMFSELRLGNAIDPRVCAPLVEDVVESINRNADALISLVRLKSADEYTYLHSVAVCALMVSLGKRLGFDADQCRDAGMAGMLHDMGKAAVPLEVLNKPGRLTPEEFEIVKRHPMQGYEMLRAAGGVSEGVLDVCRHHHERIDGKGYPDGLQGEQISVLARMGAVCDVYDAVTSNRPYKAGWDPAYAIAQMASWKGHFDDKVYQAFVRSLGIYPTGSLVRMTSGILGVVLEQNAEKLTKPKVKLFFSTNAGLPIKPRVVDLAAPLCREKIQARESPENWQFNYLNELWASDAALT